MKPTIVIKNDHEWERLVFGEIYAPNRPDADGEFMSAEEIQKMAHDFVRKQRMDQVDQQHENELTEGVVIVESFIARKNDPDGFLEGSWVVGVHIADDATWDKVLKGEINGFSMEAMVTRHETLREVDMDDTITGTTTATKGDKAHVHKFSVRYDENGKFLGGATDTVDGHFHLIERGTVTEEVNGHTHTFSSVDNVIIN